jgi:hypothetical protein
MRILGIGCAGNQKQTQEHGGNLSAALSREEHQSLLFRSHNRHSPFAGEPSRHPHTRSPNKRRTQIRGQGRDAFRAVISRQGLVEELSSKGQAHDVADTGLTENSKNAAALYREEGFWEKWPLRRAREPVECPRDPSFPSPRNDDEWRIIPTGRFSRDGRKAQHFQIQIREGARPTTQRIRRADCLP